MIDQSWKPTAWLCIGLMLCLSVISGCWPTETSGGNQDQNQNQQPQGVTGLVVLKTGDAHLGFVISDQQGNGLYGITESSSGQMTALSGGIWVAPDGSSLTVYVGSNGLPEKAVTSQGTVVVFKNWTDSTVDLGVVNADGTTEVIPNVGADSSAVTSLKSLTAKRLKQAKVSTTDIVLAIKVVTVAVSMTACIMSSGGLLTLPCASAFLSLAIAVAPTNQVLSGSSAGLSGFVCGASAGQNWNACLSTAGNLLSASDQTLQNRASEVQMLSSTGLSEDFSGDLSKWSTEGPASIVSSDGNPAPCARTSPIGWLVSKQTFEYAGKAVTLSGDMRDGDSGYGRATDLEFSNTANPARSVAEISISGSANTPNPNTVSCGITYDAQGNMEGSGSISLSSISGLADTNGDHWHNGEIRIKPSGIVEFYLDGVHVWTSTKTVANFGPSPVRMGGWTMYYDNILVQQP